MIQRLLSVFREAEDAPRLIADEETVRATYRRYQDQALYGSLVCYALFYLCRGNLGGALKSIQKDLLLGDEDLGKIGATLTMTYGVCKFLSGLVADRASPRAFMVVGLLLSALANLTFGLGASLLILIVAWGANGVFQSTGAPASAKILAVWFPASERGTKTSIWNISHQGGGGLAFIFTGWLVASFGWRAAFIVPAAIAIVGSLVLARFLHDRPPSVGLPPIDEHVKEVAVDADAKDVSFGRLLVSKVLLNPSLWLIATASLCTYLVRYGALIWCPKYLIEVRGAGETVAGLKSSLLEFIGIPGAILCGWASDRLGARRAPVAAVSLLLLALSTWLLFHAPPDSLALVVLLLAAIGFFTYGPQMLLAGVGPVDVASPRVAAAAVGFTGLMSYLGASLASWVTGWLVQRKEHFGWKSAFDFWVVAALFGALLLVPLFRYSPVKKS